MEIPTGLRDANLLKYEMRSNGKLSRQLKEPKVTASTLSEMDCYKLLVKRYQDGYFAITKLKQVKTNVMSKIRIFQMPVMSFLLVLSIKAEKHR